MKKSASQCFGIVVLQEKNLFFTIYIIMLLSIIDTTLQQLYNKRKSDLTKMKLNTKKRNLIINLYLIKKDIRERLRNNKTRTELWDDLPTELEYNL